MSTGLTGATCLVTVYDMGKGLWGHNRRLADSRPDAVVADKDTKKD